MPFDIYLLFVYSIILYNKLDFLSAKALLGENVRPARDQEFPFIVALASYDKQERYLIRFCAGALISQRDVLTCEHCLEEKGAQDVKVIVGSNDMKNGKIIDTEWWVTYNQWATFYDIHIEFEKNDVAVLRLSNNITSDIKPGVLSSMSNRNLYGKEVAVAGWGDTASGEIPTKMETVQLKVITIRDCENKGIILRGTKFVINERLLCTAATPYALLNYGDSGDPLLYNKEIIGISFGTYLLTEPKFHSQKVNLHFGIDYYRKFILSIKNKF